MDSCTYEFIFLFVFSCFNASGGALVHTVHIVSAILTMVGGGNKVKS